MIEIIVRTSAGIWVPFSKEGYSPSGKKDTQAKELKRVNSLIESRKPQNLKFERTELSLNLTHRLTHLLH